MQNLRLCCGGEEGLGQGRMGGCHCHTVVVWDGGRRRSVAEPSAFVPVAEARAVLSTADLPELAQVLMLGRLVGVFQTDAFSTFVSGSSES